MCLLLFVHNFLLEVLGFIYIHVGRNLLARSLARSHFPRNAETTLESGRGVYFECRHVSRSGLSVVVAGGEEGSGLEIRGPSCVERLQQGLLRHRR